MSARGRGYQSGVLSGPDVTVPVVGFRAWHAKQDGRLVPWTFRYPAWVPGINQGLCVSEGEVDHVVPGGDCSCGLFALAVPDRALLNPVSMAVGSVAAWGGLERDGQGFRARYARITALAYDGRTSKEHLLSLEAAAERYGVPLVHISELVDHALLHGLPVTSRLRQRQRPPDPTGPELDTEGARGMSVSGDVWVGIENCKLTIGVTQALAGRIASGSVVTFADTGVVRRAGETIATIGCGASELLVEAPVDLVVYIVNVGVLVTPELVRGSPEEDGWLVWAHPTDWARQAGSILWI